MTEHGLLEIPRSMTEPIPSVPGGRSGKVGKNAPREKTETRIVRTLDIEIGPELEPQTVAIGCYAHVISSSHYPRQ
jgi:hypothetical protein